MTTESPRTEFVVQILVESGSWKDVRRFADAGQSSSYRNHMVAFFPVEKLRAIERTITERVIE